MSHTVGAGNGLTELAGGGGVNVFAKRQQDAKVKDKIIGKAMMFLFNAGLLAGGDHFIAGHCRK